MSLPSPRPIILPASCRPLHPSQGRRLADKLVCPPRVLMLSPVLRTLLPGELAPWQHQPRRPGTDLRRTVAAVASRLRLIQPLAPVAAG